MRLSKRQLRRIIKEALGDRGDLPKKQQYKIGMQGPEDLPYGNVTGSKSTPPEQAEIEDALIACFCDWTTDGATARMSFNEFMLEVAEKLGVSPQSLAQSCELIRTGEM